MSKREIQARIDELGEELIEAQYVTKSTIGMAAGILLLIGIFGPVNVLLILAIAFIIGSRKSDKTELRKFGKFLKKMDRSMTVRDVVKEANNRGILGAVDEPLEVEDICQTIHKFMPRPKVSESEIKSMTVEELEEKLADTSFRKLKNRILNFAKKKDKEKLD